MSTAIDWVSPLPPVASGIADYSADLLPWLAERADLRILTIPGQPVEQELLEQFRHGSLEIGATNDARIPVYQMGNNPYHLEIYRAALANPGVLTLHDYVLHHFQLGRFYDEANTGESAEDYMEQLRRDHGDLGALTARQRLLGVHSSASMFELPMNRTLVRSQRGVLVHNRWVAERLRESDPGLAVEVVPMAMPLPDLPDDLASESLRHSLGISENALLLGSFGFQTRIKRTHKAIEALASPALAQAHLLIAGKAEGDLDVELEARHFGVSDRVHSLGYVPFEDFVGAIRACDVCLCLRHPTAGETSAALMRVLAAGRPALVSDYGQFVDIPDEIAIKVPAGEGEQEALVEALAGLRGDGDRLRALGEEARRWIRREHDPGRVADRLIQAITRLAGELPLAEREPAAEEPPERPSTLTWSQVRGSIEVHGAEPPWPPGERRCLEIELYNQGDCRWLATERGEGGVVVAYRLLAAGIDWTAGEKWLALPRDIAPGESCVVPLRIRRPPGASVRLEIEPHVEGSTSFSALGGPSWSRSL